MLTGLVNAVVAMLLTGLVNAVAAILLTGLVSAGVAILLTGLVLTFRSLSFLSLSLSLLAIHYVVLAVTSKTDLKEKHNVVFTAATTTWTTNAMLSLQLYITTSLTQEQ